MLQRLRGTWAVRGVEGQELLQEVQRKPLRVAELLLKRPGHLGRKRVQEGARLAVADAVDDSRRRLTQEVGHDLQLGDGVSSGKERLAQQGLGKNTPYAPDVDRVRIDAVEAAAELGGTVPPRRNVVRPGSGRLLAQEGACKPEITDLQSEEIEGWEGG